MGLVVNRLPRRIPSFRNEPAAAVRAWGAGAGARAYRVEFGFDAVGNQVLRLDELGRPSYFTFDGLRRLTHTKDAALAVTYMGYDARGGMVVRVAPAAVGEVAYMGYDAAGRVEREWFAKSGGGADSPIYFGYDQVGNLLTVQDSTILSANYFTHDKLDRLTKKSTAGGAVYYAFDASGKRTSLKDRDLEESVYVWDADGRLSKLELSGARAAYFAYDQAGMVTRRVLPGGPSSGRVNAYFTYDLAGRLGRLEHRGPAYADVIAYFAYERDADGAMTRIRHEDSENSYFRYDALGRLEWERRVTDAASRYEKYYGYDAASNRVLKIDHKLGEHTYYSHDVRNLLEKEWNQDAPETTYFEWDASQRMTAAKNPTGQTAYFSFDQRDQNSQIMFRKVGGGADQTRTFGYTGTGERVRLALGAGTMFDPITSELALSYDGRKLLAERETLTSTTERRYRHNEGPADSRGSTVEVEQDSDKLYPSMDERGSVVVLSEGGSTNENRYGYDSFGVDVPISEPLITTSQRARFVSPALEHLNTLQPLALTPNALYLPNQAQTLLSGPGINFTSMVPFPVGGVHAVIALDLLFQAQAQRTIIRTSGPRTASGPATIAPGGMKVTRSVKFFASLTLDELKKLGCVELRWIQAVRTNQRQGGGCQAKPDKDGFYTFIDPCPGDDTGTQEPFYFSKKSSKTGQDELAPHTVSGAGKAGLQFDDTPSDSFDYSKLKEDLITEFELCLVCVKEDGGIKVLECLWWGYRVKAPQGPGDQPTADKVRTLGPAPLGLKTEFWESAMGTDFKDVPYEK